MPGLLCPYSKAFGEPGKGAHRFRVGGLAAVDLLATAGLAWAVSRYALKTTEFVVLAIVFIILILVAVLVHEAFCVNTRLNAAIFGRSWPGPASQ